MFATYPLAFAGSFLIAGGLLAQTYVPDQMLRTPTDINQVTHLSGTAQAAQLDGTVDVNVANRTQAVPELSDDETVAWRTMSCVVVAAEGAPDCVAATDKRWQLVQAALASFATSRTEALGLDDPTDLPAGIDPTSGIVNKFPFGAEKKTYPYWDSALGRSVDAKFVRTEKLDGLETYVYAIDVPTTEVELTAGVMGTYANATEIYVEPVTGSVVNQVVDQRRLLEDGSPAFVLDAQFTDEQVATSVADTKDSKRMLTMLGVAPYVGYALGALLLGLAVWLDRRSRRRREVDASATPPAPQPAVV